MILVLGSGSARADDFPFGNKVLQYQAELPCHESWRSGHSDMDPVEHKMTFDKRGRLLTRDGVTTYVTDQQGRVLKATTETFGRKHIVTLVRDGSGRITRWTETDDGKVTFRSDTRYDANQFTITMPEHGDVRWVNTVVDGRVADEAQWSGSLLNWRATYTYDKAKHLVRIVQDHLNPRGEIEDSVIEEFAYDANGRLIRDSRSRAAGTDSEPLTTSDYRYDCAAK